jgi:hypothetical protein
VRLTGIVTQQAPFLDGGAYALQDQTGEIWVFTKDALPELQTEVTVEGTVRSEKLELGDENAPLTEKAFYIQEQNRSPE